MIKKYKIFVYAICKNESAFVNRWMDSVSEADGVVVVDTGSTDDTVKKLKSRGAYVFEETYDPWRFDAPRNSALDHIPSDVDICVSNDIDEIFEPGWRKKLEQAWDDDCTRAKYWFLWEEKTDYSPEKRYYMEKIHQRHGYRWIHPVHEVLQYFGEGLEKTVIIDDITLIHKPDPHKSRVQYLPLLELSTAENPNDDQIRFWLGREYYYRDLYDQAIQTLEEHIDMPSATWDEERSASMRFIACCYRSKNDNRTALSWLLRATAECMTIREPWLELARLGNDTQNWQLCYFASKKGLAILQSSKSYLVEQESWGNHLNEYAAISCYFLSFFEEALFHTQNALKHSPHQPHLINNLKIIQQTLKERKEQSEIFERKH